LVLNINDGSIAFCLQLPTRFLRAFNSFIGGFQIRNSTAGGASVANAVCKDVGMCKKEIDISCWLLIMIIKPQSLANFIIIIIINIIIIGRDSVVGIATR